MWMGSHVLAMSNSCVNPFIYGIYNEKFQLEFRRKLSGGCFRGRGPGRCRATAMVGRGSDSEAGGGPMRGGTAGTNRQESFELRRLGSNHGQYHYYRHTRDGSSRRSTRTTFDAAITG